MNDKALTAATEKARVELEKALPYIEEARAILAKALRIDPEELPEVNIDKSNAHWMATRLFQNVWHAHLHVSDPFGS